MSKSHWVHDIETLSSLFVACFIHYTSEESYTFVVHDKRNDLPALLEFLDRNRRNREKHISYNGLNFDSQVIQWILLNRRILLSLSGDKTARAIYRKAQEVISRQDQDMFSEYPEKSLFIPQLDVYRMNHWDNPQKRASLKWVQFSMDWNNLQEMPIHHSQEVHTEEEIETVVSYCKNDVLSTKNILHLCKSQIGLRKLMHERYGIPCYSYSNTKIGSELLLKLYCDKTGRKPQSVRRGRTKRGPIKVSDILFPYISFRSIELQRMLETLRGKVIVNTKGDLTFSEKFRGYQFDYGSGGMHQCIKPGIYLSDETYIIKDLDVTGLYPNLAIANGMYPAHLGDEFFQVYKNDIVDVRTAEKIKGDKGDKAIVEGFKEAANASYGNSNNKYSWLFDSQYTMQTTINGQMLLTMLVEDLVLSLEDCQLLQTNTDGATLRIRRSDLTRYEEICKNWEKLSGLQLEFAEYSKMFIWDVNSYIGVYYSGKTKCKGRFEWEDLQNHKPTHLHKNKSHLIIPKAIFHYLVHDIMPEKYLEDNRNIFDYCAGHRIRGDWAFMQTCVVDGKVTYDKMQDTIRYYISNSGCKIIKVNLTDGRELRLESGRWMQTEMNSYIERKWRDYDVNESYYLEQIYSELSRIVPVKSNQLELELFPV